MKHIILLLTLVLQINSFGQDSNKDVNEVVNSKKFKHFLENICVSSDGLRTSTPSKAGEIIENVFLEYLGISRNTDNYKLKIAEFYNKFHQYFICENITSRLKRKEHFLKRVVNTSMYRTILYDFLLEDEEELPINVNSIEIYQGKGETLLDYLEKIIVKGPNKSKFTIREIQEIEVLYETLVDDFGAKKANELK